MSSISSGKSIWSTMLSPTECDSPLDETEGENVGTEVPDAEVDNEAPEMPKKARVEETPTSSKSKTVNDCFLFLLVICINGNVFVVGPS